MRSILCDTLSLDSGEVGIVEGPKVTLPTTESAEPKNEELLQARNWGMLCHLSALLGFIRFPGTGILPIPFGHILGPLVVWLLTKNRHPFADDQGKEALNFQLSMTIYALASSILVFVLIGALLLIILVVMDMVFLIIAAVKAGNGETYRYPLTLRFIR